MSNYIQQFKNGETICINSNSVKLQYKLVYDSNISISLRTSVLYKFNENDSWESMIKYSNWKGTTIDQTIYIPTSTTGKVYLSGLNSTGYLYDLEIIEDNRENNNIQEILNGKEYLININNSNNTYSNYFIDESDLLERGEGYLSIQTKGTGCQALGAYSIAEGQLTLTNAGVSHAEGNNTIAAGDISHAEGFMSYTSGESSHAEGGFTKAFGIYSHAEGWYSYTYGECSHAEGIGTNALSNYSHTEGIKTITTNSGEHAQGSYNISHHINSYTISSIGIGTWENDRKNAFEIMQNGDIYMYGVGNYDGTNPEIAYSLNEVINNNLINSNTISYTITPGNGLYVDPNDSTVIKMIIDNDSIKADDGDEIYVNKHNIIDNNTLTVTIMSGAYNKRGRISVVTDNLNKATSISYGIVKGDEYTTYISNPGQISVNTKNLELVDDSTNKDGIVRHSSEMWRTIRADDGRLNVITANLDKASDKNYGVIKTDNETIKASDAGIISVETSNLTKASNYQYGVIKGDGNVITINNGIITINTNNLQPATGDSYGVIKTDNLSLSINSRGALIVNRYDEIEAILETNNPEHAIFRDDIEDLKNRVSRLEIS